MASALAQLGAVAARRRIAVLGAMGELGEHAPRFHAELAEPLLAAGVDHVILVGEAMQALAERLGTAPGADLGKSPRFTHCDDAATAQAALADIGLAEGDAVLVKGSNSVGLGALVAGLTDGDG